ncbi:MAG: response regulator [Gammaproteobacteria bacterium]|nr:response regulator [Gammaproteobacteria bacterium]MBT3490308.1 response regulator [Gammaproteobacteria bacterium]MBT3719889.1 response regulator [Gammaproteobacteria bacterium]MBT3844960.1 response regulator [Gammaproteobacteria bacterium]MBT3893961.1 response regulator [Gammaproteobacteria bacterium]
MNHLSSLLTLRGKLLLLAFLPFLTLFYFNVENIAEDFRYQVKSRQLDRLAYLTTHLSNLIHELQKERGTASGFLGSQGRLFDAELQGQRLDTDQASEKLIHALSDFNFSDYEFDFEPLVHELISSLDELSFMREQIDSHTLSFSESMAWYTALSNLVMATLDEISGLTHHPLTKEYLAAYGFYLQHKDQVGVERGLLTGVLTQGVFSSDTYVRLIESMAMQKYTLHEFLEYGSNNSVQLYQQKAQSNEFNVAGPMRKLALKTPVGDEVKVNPALWYDAMTQKVDILKIVEDQVVRDILSSSKEVSTQALISFQFKLVVMLLSLLTTVWLAYLLIREVERANLLESDKAIQKAIIENSERLTKAKDEFLASMSHELRTPLTVIMGNSEILSESTLDQGQKKSLQNIAHSSEALLALVNDILDLSKMEAGKFEIDLAPFCLTELLEQLEQMFALQAQDTGLHFKVEQRVDPPFQLWGDYKRIGQILLNFLSNAFKFTEQGSVTVTCWRDEDKLIFSIEDSGIGMSPDVLSRLFQPFEQADSSISRRYGGMGLGLHISQALTELMDGTIEVDSEEGKGSIFTLQLPYRESELLVHCTEGDEALSIIPNHFTGEVLVVEDTPELQLLESRMLKSLGVTVTVVNDGEEAVKIANQQPFDLILMDMQMPVMNGLEATRLLREQGNQTPIAALTANVMQKHRDQFFDAGANDFLQKPIDKTKLQQTLKKYLKPAQVVPLNHSATDTAESMQSSEYEKCGGEALCPVLVIDDEESILELYQRVLGGEWEDESGNSHLIAKIAGKTAADSSPEEFLLTVANQGLLGVELAQKALQQGHPFPLAFIDMRMPPGIDGLQTAKALRELDERIYIVFVTAYSDTDLNEINHQLGGGVLYIQKPFYQQEIQQTARMLSHNWKRDYGRFTAGTSVQITHEPPVEAVVTTADEEVDDELMAIFRESATKNRQLLIDAVTEKDWQKIKEVAHSVKGSGSSFGFPELTEKAKVVCDSYDDGQLAPMAELTMDLILELGKTLA